MLRRLAKQVAEFRHELQALPVLRLLFQKFEAVAQSVARPSRLVRALDGRLAVELELAGHRTSREKGVSITYRGMTFNENLRYDLLVDDCLLIEAKSCEKECMDLWRMQLLTYMKLMDKPLGLVINFGNQHIPTRGIKRVILKGADEESSPF